MHTSASMSLSFDESESDEENGAPMKTCCCGCEVRVGVMMLTSIDIFLSLLLLLLSHTQILLVIGLLSTVFSIVGNLGSYLHHRVFATVYLAFKGLSCIFIFILFAMSLHNMPVVCRFLGWINTGTRPIACSNTTQVMLSVLLIIGGLAMLYFAWVTFQFIQSIPEAILKEIEKKKDYVPQMLAHLTGRRIQQYCGAIALGAASGEVWDSTELGAHAVQQREQLPLDPNFPYDHSSIKPTFYSHDVHHRHRQASKASVHRHRRPNKRYSSSDDPRLDVPLPLPSPTQIKARISTTNEPLTGSHPNPTHPQHHSHRYHSSDKPKKKNRRKTSSALMKVREKTLAHRRQTLLAYHPTHIYTMDHHQCEHDRITFEEKFRRNLMKTKIGGSGGNEEVVRNRHKDFDLTVSRSAGTSPVSANTLNRTLSVPCGGRMRQNRCRAATVSWSTQTETTQTESSLFPDCVPVSISDRSNDVVFHVNSDTEPLLECRRQKQQLHNGYYPAKDDQLSLAPTPAPESTHGRPHAHTHTHASDPTHHRHNPQSPIYSQSHDYNHYSLDTKYTVSGSVAGAAAHSTSHISGASSNRYHFDGEPPPVHNSSGAAEAGFSYNTFSHQFSPQHSHSHSHSHSHRADVGINRMISSIAGRGLIESDDEEDDMEYKFGSAEEEEHALSSSSESMSFDDSRPAQAVIAMDISKGQLQPTTDANAVDTDRLLNSHYQIYSALEVHNR